MNFKRVALLVIAAVMLLSVAIYSQTKTQLINIPHTTYSGEDLRFTVTDTSNGRIEGVFEIQVRGVWFPIPSAKPPTVKGLQSN